MSLYRELWKGPITLVCEPSQEPSDNLDNVEIPIDASPFQVVCEELTDDRLLRLFAPNSLVLASEGERFNSVSRLCRRASVPCVYITENTLRTRIQIMKEQRRSSLRSWWCSSREFMRERAQVKAIILANAVQCNGTPTYAIYKSLTPLPHLFFDTRIEETMLATPERVVARSAHFGPGRPIRLVFSGRLKLIKGVDHLPLVAAQLRRLGIPFEMSICGDGECVPQLRNDIAKMELKDSITLRGTLDFKTELVPFVTNETDLFVCCHRQGDPSCTYLETMACGVPIIGYSNEAFEGLAQVAGTGWVTPINRPLELAERIACLYKNPTELLSAALRSLTFARDHTFEKTFRRRVEHLDLVVATAWI